MKIRGKCACWWHHLSFHGFYGLPKAALSTYSNGIQQAMFHSFSVDSICRKLMMLVCRFDMKGGICWRIVLRLHQLFMRFYEYIMGACGDKHQ